LIDEDGIAVGCETALLPSFWGSSMDLENLAKRIRETCIEVVLQAYEDAGIQGLCAEGRWEAAISALRTIDLAPLLRESNVRQ
jgi:hypothetical protein